MKPARLACGKVRASGFTLLELMVVLVMVAVLGTLLFAVLSTGREEADRAGCISKLRQIGTAIMLYAGDHDGRIPCGPKAPPYTNASSFYPSTGTATSLISLQNGKPVGLGILLDKYLAKTPEVLFCPGADQKIEVAKELAKVGKEQAQGSYYYRQAGNTQLFDPPGLTEPQDVRLSNLGENRNGQSVQALVMDTMFLSPPALKSFNVTPRTNHNLKFANVLYADGRVESLPNTGGRFTVDVRNPSEVRSAFSKILGSLEGADAVRAEAQQKSGTLETSTLPR